MMFCLHNIGTPFLWVLVLALPAISQEQSQFIKVNTRLVSVPVVATRNGATVLGLKKEDFIVQQDGQRVEIKGFEVIAPDRSAVKDLSISQIAKADPDPDSRFHSLAIIVIDPLNTPEFSQKDGISAVIRFLAKGLNPGQPTALLLLTRDGLKIVTDFSTDVELLKVAAAQLHQQKGGKRMVREVTGNTNGEDSAFGGSANPDALPSNVAGANLIAKVLEALINDMHAEERVSQYEVAENARITLRAFSVLTHALIKLPGRKSLVWLSGGLPFPSEYKRYSTGEISDMYSRILDQLNDASVSVYPIHLRGLEVVAPENDVTIDRYHRAAGLNASASYDRANSRVDTARDLAQKTGGLAFVNTNDFAKALRQALDDSATYYMLTYYLSEATAKPGWHSLKVGLRESKGIHLRARSGFMVSPTAR
jgi:VWFA-related protein